MLNGPLLGLHQSLSGKPPKGTPLNLNHPLLRDVYCVYPLDEMGGLPKCANNPALDITNSASPPEYHPSDPDYRSYNGANAEDDYVGIPTAIAPLDFTMFCVMKGSVFSGTGYTLALNGPGTGSGSRSIGLAFTSVNTTRIFARLGSNNNFAADAGVGLPYGGKNSKWQRVVAVSRDQGGSEFDLRLYVDGVFQDNEIEAYDVATWTLDGRISIGARYEGTIQKSVSTSDNALCGLIQRAWTDTEIALWAADPWQFFDRPVIDPAVFMDLAAPAGGPTFPYHPIAAYRHNMMR